MGMAHPLSAGRTLGPPRDLAARPNLPTGQGGCGGLGREVGPTPRTTDHHSLHPITVVLSAARSSQALTAACRPQRPRFGGSIGREGAQGTHSSPRTHPKNTLPTPRLAPPCLWIHPSVSLGPSSGSVCPIRIEAPKFKLPTYCIAFHHHC